MHQIGKCAMTTCKASSEVVRSTGEQIEAERQLAASSAQSSNTDRDMARMTGARGV